MLARFVVQNFLSIDAPVEFSMEASKESHHLQRVAEGKPWQSRLLQSAALWGGNASGKSNFIKSLRFARSLIVTGTRPDGPTGRIPFKLREAAAKEPSRFLFEFLVDFDGEERLFRYGFGVTSREVIDECLVELTRTTEKIYFTRTSSQPGQKEPAFTLDWWDRRAVTDEERLLAKVLTKGTRPNQLFLHEAMDRNLVLLAPIYRWFRDQLHVLSANAAFVTFETLYGNRQDLRDYISTVLGRADTGIHTIASEPIPIESIGIDPKVREDLLADLKEDGSGLILRSPEGRRFSVFLKNGELNASRVVTYRKSVEGRDILFETSEESDGTLRLFDLAPTFHDLTVDGSKNIYVIDEPDRGMHTQLTRALLESYLHTRSKDNRAQFIFSTHDALLLDQSLFRRDEIWFVERSNTGATFIESLSDYKEVRSDKDIRKAYLEGRFSGVPKIATLDLRPTISQETQDSSTPAPDLFDYAAK